jgi:hypothetical protein
MRWLAFAMSVLLIVSGALTSASRGTADAVSDFGMVLSLTGIVLLAWTWLLSEIGSNGK